MNGVYDPMYEELGLPVDPHLRYLMLNPNFIRGNANKYFYLYILTFIYV